MKNLIFQFSRIIGVISAVGCLASSFACFANYLSTGEVSKMIDFAIFNGAVFVLSVLVGALFMDEV